MQKILKSFLLLICAGVLFTSCYSVFQGGTSGIVVDSESTSNPKNGIANVDIYAYTDSKTRDSDFKRWVEGTVFCPTADYYGHTSTGGDGSFTLSKLVWKSFKPSFGKDADVEKVYLLFYHKDYGLTKGETIIVSDDAAQTVYQELIKIRKTMPLSLTFKDVKDNSQTTNTVAVEISVPQTNGKITDAEPIVYKTSITGNGTVAISYPRYFYDADGNESNNCPEVTITYFQATEDVSWKACYNNDNTDKNFAFRDLSVYPVKKVLPDYSSYSIVLYGKASKIAYPSFNGTYHANIASNEYGDKDDDGKVVVAKLSDGTVIGSDTTSWSTLGSNGTIMHGNFSISSNDLVEDSTYTTKTVKRAVKFYVDDVEVTSSISEISSDKNSYNVSLN